MSIDPITATHETFAPFVGQRFTVQGPGGPLPLVLDNVKLFSEATRRDNHLEIDGVVYPPRRAFALTLEGPKDPLLPDAIYTVDLPGGDRLDLYVKPFRQDHDCTLYEVVFN